MQQSIQCHTSKTCDNNKKGLDMKLAKLDNKGVSHSMLVLSFVVLFAIFGVGYSVASKTSSANAVSKKCVQKSYKKGSKGTCVKYMQELLNYDYRIVFPSQDVYDLTADGNFGSDTKTRVKAFQGAKHLTKSGVVGPKTWSQMCLVLKGKLHIDGYYPPSNVVEAGKKAGCQL